MRKVSLLVGAAIAAGLGFSSWALAQGLGPGQPNIVARVDGHPIYAAELRVYADKHKAEVAASYSSRGVTAAGADFWDTDFGDGTPREKLLDAALAENVRDKEIQLAAAERGIAAPLDMREAEAARGERNQAKAEGTEIYGPNQLSAEQYLSTLMSSTVDDLKTALLKERNPSDAELKAAYDSLSDSFKLANFTASGWSIYPAPDDPIEEPFKCPAKAKCEPFELDSTKIGHDDTDTQDLAEQLREADKGEFIQVGETAYYVQEFSGGGVLSYEQAPRLGAAKWVNDEFERYIAERVANANVEVFSGASSCVIG
jgi:hypothetical protein